LCFLLPAQAQDTFQVNTEEQIVQLEANLLLSQLLLQWADSLPAGTSDTEKACHLAFKILRHQLLTLMDTRSSNIAVVPADTQLALPLSTARQELQQQQQQQHLPSAAAHQQTEQEQQQPEEGVQQQQQQQQQILLAPPAALLAECSSSSSRSRSRGPGARRQHRQQLKTTYTPVPC
jgi:hypothetical protein